MPRLEYPGNPGIENDGALTVKIPPGKATPEVMTHVAAILELLNDRPAPARKVGTDTDPIRKRDGLRAILKPGLPPRRMGD